MSAYFQKIFSAEKELTWFLVHILVQKVAFLKQLAIQCLILSNNLYQLFFGTQNCCVPKDLIQSQIGKFLQNARGICPSSNSSKALAQLDQFH